MNDDAGPAVSLDCIINHLQEDNHPMEQKILKIFITDDSEIILKKIPEMLRDLENVQVVGHAESTFDTLRLVKEMTPDIVILDIKLPGESGMDILKVLKDEKLVPAVIIFTNYPYPEYRQRCYDLGADYFYDKSTEFNQMVETVRKIAGLF